MKHIGTSWQASGPGDSILSKTGVQAVILTGGLGTRLRPYTIFLPKPMLTVGEKPILQHIVEWLQENGVVDIVVSIGYLGKTIQNYFGDGSGFGVHIDYAESTLPLGTAGQLKAAESKIKGRFLCLYGDSLLSLDLQKLLAFHQRHHATFTMALMKYSTELKYGFMETDSRGVLTEWKEKPKISGYINVGCYVMEKRFLNYIPAGKKFGMDLAFERAKRGGERLCGVKLEGEFLDIGDRRSFQEANALYTERFGKVP